MNLKARIRWACHLLELYRLAEETNQPRYLELKRELKRLQALQICHRSAS